MGNVKNARVIMTIYEIHKFIVNKGKETNLIESFNPQLRHYCSNLIRKGKYYVKSIDSFINNLHIIFYAKIYLTYYLHNL